MTTASPTFDIVISYRREDTQAASNAVYRELVRRFGADRVLLDITSIPVGEDYDQFVRRIIASAKAVIVIIGPQWLTIEKHGKRRLEQEDDAVRGEVVAALASGVPVIPLLVENAPAIEADALPAALKPIARLNMMPVLERYWDTDMNTLAQRLAPLLGVEPEAPARANAAKTGKRPWVALATGIFVLAGVTAGWFYVSAARAPVTKVDPAPGTATVPPVAKPAAATPDEIVQVKVPLARRPLAITMIFETGRPRAYSAVYTLGDDLHYGAGFASLKHGSLLDLLQRYTSFPNARFAGQLNEYLPRVDSHDPDLLKDDGFKNLLTRAAGEDPAMIGLQDQMIEERFFGPARVECNDIGVKSALGFALIADVNFNMGKQRYARIKQTTIRALDGTPITGIDEHDWLRAFAKQVGVAAAKSTFPNAVRRRTDAYVQLMDQNRWDLAAPVTVGGFELVDP